METIAFSVLLLLLVGYYVGSHLYGAPLHYQSRLGKIAKEIGGQAVLGRSTVGGHVIWNRRGLPFYFYERKMVPDRWTILSVGYDSMKLPLYQIRPDREVVPLLSPPRRIELHSGDPQFDGRFSLRAPAGLQAPDVPLGALRRFHEVATLIHPSAPMLEVHENRIRLYVPGVLRGSEQRRQVIEMGCQLLEAILMGKGHEVTSKQLKVIDVLTGAKGAQCPICGETIHARPLRCAKCGVPHHRECWEYVGSCAIFGCGGTRTEE